MNRRMIAYVLGLLLFCEAGLLLLPLIVALIYGDGTIPHFLMTIGALCAIGALLLRLKPKDKTIYARDGLVIVALGWIILSLFGALPFYLTGEIPRFIDALFETVSGFTTTGSSILTDIEVMSKSLLFWRSFTHWIGGMGVLVFVMAVLPLSGGGGDLHLMKAESPGPVVGKLVPKSNKTARILYLIYFVLTDLCIILLLIGGMPLFDSLCTAFGTAGTGGFGVRNSSIAEYSTFCQTVITVFMALFGVNFNAYFLIVMGKFREAFKSEELKTYFGILITAILVIAINITKCFDSFFEALHHAAFQVSSIMTTTGFATTDFNQWPELSRMILIMLMCVGACASSTGGGFKVSRVILCIKYAFKEIRTISHPRNVKVLKFDGAKVKESTIRGTLAFFGIYIFILILSLIAVSLDNVDNTTSTTSVIACLNNIGPNLASNIYMPDGSVVYGAGGPYSNYSYFSDFSKLVLILDMLFGRLEIFPLIVLLTPPKKLKQKILYRKGL